ncbi:MAG: bacillithiol biosynthesis deacetylase BshB1 [Planctomycetaceae bacterium]|nr:bacillithiol biosynthesis deacetylase BshB1 [Planctomycetaceae bacterium]
MTSDQKPDSSLPTSQPLDLLVVAVHPDDAELGAGGTIIKLARAGKRVGVLDLTTGEPTPHGSDEKRIAETAAASRVLGLSWRKNLGLPNRRLEPTIDARFAVATVFRQTRPKVILSPYWDDVHPDHVAASRLIDDARFWSKLSRTDMPGEPFYPPKLYNYFSIHLRIIERPSFVLDVSDTFEDKLKATACYESQFGHRPPEFPTLFDDLRGRARYWGWSIGTGYGEPFASRETVGVTDFDSLLSPR